jgi:hypothetical protein
MPYAVASGTIAAARSAAPNSPAPNRNVANGPASGRNACATSLASSMRTPERWSVAAQAMAIDSPMTPVRIEPTITSMRSQLRFASVIFLSTA